MSSAVCSFQNFFPSHIDIINSFMFLLVIDISVNSNCTYSVLALFTALSFFFALTSVRFRDSFMPFLFSCMYSIVRLSDALLLKLITIIIIIIINIKSKVIVVGGVIRLDCCRRSLVTRPHVIGQGLKLGFWLVG